MDVSLFLFACISALILFSGFQFIKKIFFGLALSSSSLLNILLDSIIDEDTKQKGLLKNLGPTVIYLVILVFSVYLIFTLSLLPFIIWKSDPNYFDIPDETFTSTESGVAFGLATGIYLLISRRNKADYSDWSKLLHRIILNNPNIPQKLIRKKTDTKSLKKVIVTGLARAGTTALTNDLYTHGSFDSLSYASMPFLLAPSLGLKLNQKSEKKKERAHGDSIEIGIGSIEALEEYFFKVEMRDSFIQKDSLKSYEINQETIDRYNLYITQICNPGKTYLAKNNNFLLRAKSHLQLDKELKVILLIRNPLEQASSLLKQHKSFIKLQNEDSFILEYMNWLVHHEFGNNHLPFDFNKNNKGYSYSTDSLNYWLNVWLNYYTYALEFKDSEQVLIVRYQDYLKNRIEILTQIKDFSKEDLNIEEQEAFVPNSKDPELDFNQNLLNECLDLYAKFS